MPKKTVIKRTDNECLNKVRHETQKEDQPKADRMERWDGRARCAYHCTTCGGWHVANNERMGVRR